MKRPNNLTVIYAHKRKRLTKRYDAEGNVVSGYDRFSELHKVKHVKCKTLEDLRDLLEKLQDTSNACIIRGQLREDAEEPILRRKTHFTDAPTRWVMLDVDQLQLPKGHASQRKDPEGVAIYARMHMPLPFRAAACVWQASASAGLVGKRAVKVHLWFRLSRACTSEALRNWLTDQPNLDPSVFRSVQPHYTAAPILECEDPMGGERLGILEGLEPCVMVPATIDARAAGSDKPLETVEISKREKGLRDLSEQAIKAAKKRAAARAQELLERGDNPAYQDAYACGCVLGHWLAFESWNDKKHGHNALNSSKKAQRLAKQWGEAFKAKPKTSQPAKIYIERVWSGMWWSFARAREDLALKQNETHERLGQIRAQELAGKLEQKRQLKALADNPTQTQLEVCGRKLGAYTGAEEPLLDRSEVIARMVQESGLSKHDAESALSLGEDAPINLDAWRAGLKVSKTGEVAGNEYNLCMIILRHPALQGVFRYNVRTMHIEIVSRAPWMHETPDKPIPFIVDTMSSDMQEWLGSIGIKDATVKQLFTALRACISRLPQVDPFIEYLGFGVEGISKKQARKELESMPSKLETWLADCFGAKGNREYLAAVGKRFLISAVARAYNPGEQADSILVLSGREGLRKTAAARSLGGVIGVGGFRNLHGIHSKDDLMTLQGPIIFEAGEMQAFQGKSEEASKNFLTKTSDAFRAPYGHQILEHPRRCVGIGSTNEEQFLPSVGDHRRYWPVRCTKRSEPLAPDYVAALWREAALRYFAGEQWHLTDAEVELHAVEVGRARFGDVWQTILEARLEDDKPVTIREAITMCDPESRLTMADQHRAARALKAIGRQLRHRRDGNVWL